jgi:cellulose synthase/poly-beta-1,6-N-acetylglucosamine synthase-like glycosyltransferase
MEGLLLTAMALVLLALAGLILVGRRALRPAAGGEGTGGITVWPSVAVLVPVTGAAPGLAARLEAVLRQDYPQYQVVFATRDVADPAVAVIRSLFPSFSHARHVIAGPARSCGQKNQNLLAALKLVGRTPEVLVFCDSNQEAPGGWLKELVAPLAAGEAQVASGYHQVIVETPAIAALGRAISVMTLYLTKGFPCLNQPWGGATAIRRRLFEDLEAARLWSENVVDDVSLAARLIRAGIRVGLSRGACLHTLLPGETLAGWRDWLIRQWIYLKFCLPLSWLAAGLAAYLLTALTALAGLSLVLTLWGPAAPVPAWAALLFLSGLTAAGLYLRTLHPQPGPLHRWLPAFFAAIAMASWGHLKTVPTMRMGWRGISYQVAWRGKVVEIAGSNQ